MDVRIVFLFIYMCLLANNHAQITISNANPYNNSNHLINNVLFGGGVSANSVTYQGDPIQVGFFSAINSNLGIDSGIVLSTGDIIVTKNTIKFINTNIFIRILSKFFLRSF